MRQTKTETRLMFKFNRRDWERKTGEACQAFIAEMKRTIPSQFRIFDGEVNQWSIAIQYAGVIKDLKHKYLN
jgi:hypothetical protein